MTDSFKDHPQSISEIRANKTLSCADWTPRDVLIDLLRRIDGGEKIDALVVIARQQNEDGSATRFTMATPDLVTALGLMSRAAWMMNGS